MSFGADAYVEQVGKYNLRQGAETAWYQSESVEYPHCSGLLGENNKQGVMRATTDGQVDIQQNIDTAQQQQVAFD